MGKTVSTWPEADIWERLHMDWGYVKDPGNILVIVAAGSGWIEAFPAGNRTSETVKIYLSQIFARFGISKNLVSDNGPLFVSGDLKQWCESLGIKKIESPVYHPRANGLAERAVQTVKRALQAWSPKLNVLFGAFLQRALMTHRNTSKTRSKTPVELLLGRRLRLPAIADFDLCEPILFKANENTKTVPATFIIRKGLNTSFIEPENSARTILVSDNQIARLDEDNVKIEPAVEETISQSKQQMWDLHFKMKLLQPHHLQSTNNPKPQSLHEHQQETKNNPTDLEKLYPQTCLKKEEGCDDFKETSRNLEVFFIKVSKNERRTCLTNFIAVSISNGHKTKLNSNFVFALSLSY